MSRANLEQGEQILFNVLQLSQNSLFWRGSCALEWHRFYYWWKTKKLLRSRTTDRHKYCRNKWRSFSFRELHFSIATLNTIGMINSWGNPSLNICVYFARVQWLSWQELCVFLLWTLLWMFILKLFIQLCISAIFSWRMCFNNYNRGGLIGENVHTFRRLILKMKSMNKKKSLPLLFWLTLKESAKNLAECSWPSGRHHWWKRHHPSPSVHFITRLALGECQCLFEA